MSRLKKDGSADVRYFLLMERVQERFDTIARLKSVPMISLSDAETVGAHLRKIVEAVAFGCIIAMEHSVKEVPRSAAGHWNAENIFVALKKKGDFPYPDPSEIRFPTAQERQDHNIETVIEGVVERRISVDDLRAIYRRTHPWTHEENPYVLRPVTEKNLSTLLSDVDRVRELLRTHRIGIQGRSFVCRLWDPADGKTKVGAVEKVSSL